MEVNKFVLIDTLICISNLLVMVNIIFITIHSTIAVGDRMFWGCNILILFKSRLITFAQISPKYNPICPNLTSFAQQKFC